MKIDAPKTVLTNVRITKALHRRLRMFACATDTTIAQVMGTALTEHMDRIDAITRELHAAEYAEGTPAPIVVPEIPILDENT